MTQDRDRIELRSSSVSRTIDYGKRIGRVLRPGELVRLDGGLGAGKTHLVKGIALGLEVPPDVVVASPTFVLMREYPGRVRLLHFDWYRLGGADEVETLGLDESLAEGAVVVVEWGGRFPEADPAARATWSIDMEESGQGERIIRIGLNPLDARLSGLDLESD